MEEGVPVDEKSLEEPRRGLGGDKTQIPGNGIDSAALESLLNGTPMEKVLGK
ncbi:hypothetical protein [Thermococcus sp.]